MNRRWRNLEVEARESLHFHERSIKAILVRADEEKNCRGRLKLFRDDLGGSDENVGRNMDDKGNSVKSQVEMWNKVLAIRGKAIPIIERQRTLLNCVHA